MKKARRLHSIAVALSFMVVVCSFCFDPHTSFAAPETPDIVIGGLTEYQSSGPDAAIKAWLKGSAVESSPEAQSQANVLRQIEAMYGKYVGYHIIRARDMTPICTRVYLTVDYEKGPLFAVFTAYKSADKWILANFIFNTKAEAVLPQCIICE